MILKICQLNDNEIIMIDCIYSDNKKSKIET